MIQKVITKDGSVTLHNKEFDETYHSFSGAIQEAREKHVIPSEILKKANKKEVTILDVCLGLGYNSLVAIHEIKKVNPLGHIIILALENDRELLQQLHHIPIQKKLMQEYKVLQELIVEALEKKIATKEKITLKLYLGDATTEIKKIKEKVDAVFFDPFSPKKCPNLWTKEFFLNVYNLMKKGTRLTTYSCARQIRENMKEVRFQVIDGPYVGRYAPSTIGVKN